MQAGDIVFKVISYRVNIFGSDITLPVLDIVFAFLIHYLYKTALGASHTQVSWLQGLFATVVMASGGGSTVALLRGEPLGVLNSNEFWIIHCLTYVLMFSNDFSYQVISFLFSLPVIQHVFTVSDGFLRTMAMLQFGVDGVDISLGSNRWMAQIICGTLAGCGGGLWMDTFHLAEAHWSFGTPLSLKAVSADMKMSFATVILYMCLVDDFGFLQDIFGISFMMDRKEIQAWCALLLTTGLILLFSINATIDRNEKKIKHNGKDE